MKYRMILDDIDETELSPTLLGLMVRIWSDPARPPGTRMRLEGYVDSWATDEPDE